MRRRSTPAGRHGRWRPSSIIREAVLFAWSGRLLSLVILIVATAAIGLIWFTAALQRDRMDRRDTELRDAGRDVWTFEAAQGIATRNCLGLAGWGGVDRVGGVGIGEVEANTVVVPFVGEMLAILSNADRSVVASVALGPTATESGRLPSGQALVGGELVPAAQLAGGPRLEGFANTVLVRSEALPRVQGCHVSFAPGLASSMVPNVVSALSLDTTQVAAAQRLAGPTRSELVAELEAGPLGWMAPALGAVIGIVGVGTALSRRSELALYRDLRLPAMQVTTIVSGAFVLIVIVSLVLATSWTLALTANAAGTSWHEPYVIDRVLTTIGGALAVLPIGTFLVVASLGVGDRR